MYNKLKLTVILIFIIIFGIILSSCASSGIQSQISFGIRAAQKDLWDEAIFRWKKVVESNPASAAAHNNLAVAYEKKGLWEEAKKEYELALKLAPNNRYIQANYSKFKASLAIEETSPFEDKDNKNVKNNKK